ncbi:hypothetical protein IEO21_09264 [Rhodonia placenta]|uniref:Fungal-type protein kinase domain-containing protein n=1 Tax=Rhodonia placenta TaxID=104341 RepID=A0A8H7TYE2_9APHY|nr:hypothetical protein IEO21_09264 [Postia placenta]
MKDILVQMPVLDFLQRFVRGKEPMAEIKAKLAEIKLNKDKFTVQERHMYNDLCEFINTISDICSEGGVSGLKLVAKDTGANPDTSIGGDGSKNKPDVSIFPERDETHATCQPAMKAKQGAANAKQAQTPFKAATSWHRASLVIECKSSNSDGHPFSFRPASTNKSTKAPGTSDKECDSAAPNPQAEKDVFLPQADEAIKSRGQLSDYAMHLMRTWKDRMVQDKELSDYHIERYKEAMETKWPIHKVTIPREDLISAAELEPKVDEASAPKDSPQAGSDIPTEDLTLLIGKPLSMSNSPTGRSTIGYVAFDIRGKRLVFMRDSWPYDSPLRKTERIVYKDLWQNGVTNIATPISGGIVKNGDKIHRTITQKYGNAVYGKDTRARIHFRLITDEVYEPLDNCKCSYELILVLSEALLGKCLSEDCIQTWTKADILHCDISRANVMVKRTGPKGTWQFSSAMLLQYPMKLRQVSDDLESFVHVLHWTILMWYEHSLSGLPSELRRLVSRTYDEFETFVDYDTGGIHKFNNMRLGQLPFSKLSSEPLKSLTQNLAEICKEHYNASSTKEQIAKLEDIKIEKGKKSPSQPPAAPVEIDISVRHYNLVEHQGGHAKSSHTEDARPLLDTSTTPKLQEHFWIWHAFREVIEDMEKNRYTQITIDKVDKPQFTPATESATQQSTRGQKRPSQSSGESTRSSKKAKTTHGTRTMSSSMGTIFEEDEHSGGET